MGLVEIFGEWIVGLRFREEVFKVGEGGKFLLLCLMVGMGIFFLLVVGVMMKFVFELIIMFKIEMKG